MPKEKKEIIIQPSHVKVFNYTKAFIEKNIYSPTLDEIAAGIKMSMRQVYNLVNDLVELGVMEKTFKTERGIKIIKDIRG